MTGNGIGVEGINMVREAWGSRNGKLVIDSKSYTAGY